MPDWLKYVGLVALIAVTGPALVLTLLHLALVVILGGID